ncbi:hypothetical protein [Nonomuraea jabiensis]|uniref:hypothetical protein n=1 Tax=Nonomuraea jabiensis TaxID=882448 RepID=UPI0036B78F85
MTIRRSRQKVCAVSPVSGRPMDGQALSKPALLAHQAVLDQQIKDPLLLAAILAALFQVQAGDGPASPSTHGH